MFIFFNGVRQVLRTPIKTILFLLLIMISAAFLSIGADLWFVSQRNLQKYENSFITIGTVQQKPNIMKEASSWDASRKAYSYFRYPVYDRNIPISVLDFKNANYIHVPENRPYYGAYHESYVTYEYPISLETHLSIFELEPLEDCIPSEPVKMKVKRELYGNIGYLDEIWFCDYFNDNPAPLYAGKTYIMSLQSYPFSIFTGFDSSNGFEYIPSIGIKSAQYDKNGVRVPDIFGVNPEGWEEVTEGYYDTPRGQRWFELIKGIEKFSKTIPVVPTNATHLLMDFYNGNANIVDGRDISKQEFAEGSKVCLIQRRFAKNNGLKVGDVIPLPLYYANYQNAASHNFFPGGNSIGFSFSLLNAQGKSYPVFQDEEYTIVGIYEALGGSYSISGFESGMNTIVIPWASVEKSDENNIVAWSPMQAYNTSFEIPNGTIDKFIKEWSSQGVEGLDIQFYDKGYSQLKDGFERMRSISVLLMIVGMAIMLLVLIFFTFLFIVKNKKRTAIERSLGFGRGKCAISLLSGMLMLSVLGIIFGSGTGYLLSSVVMSSTGVMGNMVAFDLQYSSWVNNADKLVEVQMNLQSLGIVTFVFVGFTLLTMSILIASIGVWQNLKYEPLKLMSAREDE